MTYQYVQHPSVRSIVPQRGTYNGGTTVVLSGLYLHHSSVLSPKARCRFQNKILFDNTPPQQQTPPQLNSSAADTTTNSILVIPLAMNQTTVSCVVPSLSTSMLQKYPINPTSYQDTDDTSPNAIPVLIEFTANGIDYYSSKSSMYYYIPTPVVLSYRPTIGNEKGQTRVKITGIHLQRGQGGIVCRFGGSSALVVHAIYHNSTSITCVTPLSLIGPSSVNVYVSINGGVDWIRGPHFFDYTISYQVEHIVPSRGTTRGGTSVYLMGQSFTSSVGNKCRFGQHVVQALYVNATTLLCETPRMHGISGGSGSSNGTSSTTIQSSMKILVELSNNGGFDYVDTGHYFTFYKSVVLTSVSPQNIVNGK